MVKLTDIQKKTDELSSEDKEGLLAYILQSLDTAPEGITDEEIKARDFDLASGAVQPISHSDFFSQVRVDL